MIAYVPLLIGLLGMVVYWMAAPPKAQELGRLMFFAGILVTLFAFSGHAIKIFP